MKKKFLLSSLVILSLIIILSLSVVHAESNPCNPTIQLVSQDPNPAVPNDYVKVLFEVSDLGNCEGYALKLEQEYPFSLDSNSTGVQTIQTNPFASDYKSVWTIPYKIRIDGDAFDGDYTLKLKYHEGGNENFDSYVQSGFNLSIKDSRTSFDAVIQESSGNDVSIAIANIGKYTANSVVVRIPEQESFVATGTDGQMVGNLESGDYTIVGFTVSQKMSSRNMTRGAVPSNPETPNSKLKFDIYYTDNIGERRVANMELPLNIGNSSVGLNGFTRNSKTSSTSWFSSWVTWVIVIIIIILGYIFYKKNPEKLKNLSDKIKHLIHKNDKNKNLTPNWVSNAKKKEKGK